MSCFHRRKTAKMMVLLAIILVNIMIALYMENTVSRQLMKVHSSQVIRNTESRQYNNETKTKLRSLLKFKFKEEMNNLKDFSIAAMNEMYQEIFKRTHFDKELGEKNIDIKNDYYPFVDFRFVSPEIRPEINTTSKIFMMVLVNSGAKGDDYRKRRYAIRATWGNHSNCDETGTSQDGRLKDLKWRLVFVVGKTGTKDDVMNIEEARQHKDMIIGNITDNYINNVVKLYMGTVWASRFDIKYILKTDDDVYVRISRVIEYLANASFPKPFYGGMTYPVIRVDREIKGKWTVSWKYYEETHFPKFNPGAFFILSTDLLYRLFIFALVRKPFHTDDAYVAVAMRYFEVYPSRIDLFRVGPRMPEIIRSAPDCDVLKYISLGDAIDPNSSRLLHDRFQSYLCNNQTIKC